MAEIKTVGVVGAGQMGNGIAHVCALAGYNVILNDISQDALDAGLSTIEKNLGRQVSRDLINVDQMKAAQSRFQPLFRSIRSAKSTSRLRQRRKTEKSKRRFLPACVRWFLHTLILPPTHPRFLSHVSHRRPTARPSLSAFTL